MAAMKGVYAEWDHQRRYVVVSAEDKGRLGTWPECFGAESHYHARAVASFDSLEDATAEAAEYMDASVYDREKGRTVVKGRLTAKREKGEG